MISICVFGFSLISRGQNAVVKSEKKSDVAKEEQPVSKVNVVDPNAVKVKDNQTFIDGTVPTPEEQGFTKQTINGKDTYIKEEGQIMQQYTPKK